MVNIVWDPNINERPGKARKTKNLIQFCSNEGQERQREKVRGARVLKYKSSKRGDEETEQKCEVEVGWPKWAGVEFPDTCQAL